MTRVVAQVQANAYFYATVPADLQNIYAVCHVQRQWFFHQNMLAGVGGHFGVFDVQVVGGGDVDRIDSRISQNILN